MKKENKNNKKLASAFAMFMLSAAMLGTSTYAWFTMNKEVKVVGMEMKAHAEEGLLINEVALATSPTWDEQATGNTTTAIELRPASSYNLTAWWHANSKKVNNEAGAKTEAGSTSIDTDNTVQLAGGDYYTDISGLTPNNIAAVAGSQAETNIYWSDATYGDTTSSYDNGEGYYVKYTYYLKSSSTDDLTVAATKLTANVTATHTGTQGSEDLDKALRVGIGVMNDAGTGYALTKVFAPVSGADASYYVTGTAAGGSYTEVQPADGSTDVVLNPSAAVTIPNNSTDGKQVDVFLWFEGEDTNCQSRYITSSLDDYEINITFKDADIN